MEQLTDPMVASVGSEIADWLRDNIKPIFLILATLGIIRFVLSNEFSRLLAFMAGAVVVGLFVFSPETVEALIRTVADLFKSGLEGGQAADGGG